MIILGLGGAAQLGGNPTPHSPQITGKADMKKAPFYQNVSEGPESGQAYWIETEDDVRIRVGVWRPEGETKGTIFVFPGRTEYIEKYGRTASELHRLGYATFLIDWRGQGHSDRATKDPRTGHVDRFLDYQNDVKAMVKAGDALELPKPWYLLGHSMGACIGARAIAQGLPVTKCAFTSPMWGINLSAPKRFAAWPLSWAYKALGKGDTYTPGTKGESYVLVTPFEENRLTQDSDMYQYYIKHVTTLTDLQIGAPSFGWFWGALKETKSISKWSAPSIPCVVFCGPDDALVDVKSVRDRVSQWPTGTLHMIESSRHDMLCEIPEIRNDVIRKIDDLFGG